MYRKMLIVGLGGSGGKTLRFLKRDLRKWLAQPSRANPDAYWSGGIPEGWQFLHIDSPTIADGLEAGGDVLGDREYVGLVGKGVELRSVMNTLDGVPGGAQDLTSWRVDHYKVKVPIQIGAGQMRAVGRSIGLAYSETMRRRLEQTIARLRESGVQPELNRLYEHVHGKPASGGSPDPFTIVVSSLAGGTGAGLLLDVFDILRSLNPVYGENTIGLYYTPDAFPASAGGGVHPNSLGAISEVLNGAWWNGNDVEDPRTLDFVPSKQSRITNHLARLVNPLRTTGAHCNFLIGGTNAEDVQMGIDAGLFEMVGGALLSWVTDEKVQQQFVAYMVANWQMLAQENAPPPNDTDVLVNKGSMAEWGMPAFNALGFARVSVGTDYLRRYAARMIARESAFHLSEAHLHGERAQTIRDRGISNPSRIVELLVEAETDRFMRAMDVFGRFDPTSGESFDIGDQVRMDLLPSDLVTAFEDQMERIRQEVKDRRLNAGGWAVELEPLLEDARDQLEQEIRRGLPRSVDSWLRQATDAVTRAVEGEAGEHGVLVARGLVERLRSHILDPNDGIVVELVRRGSDFRSYAMTSTMVAYVSQQLSDTIGDGKAGIENVNVSDVIRTSLNYAWGGVEAEQCDRAALLLESFASGFLRPVSDALQNGNATLVSAEGELQGWPAWSEGRPPSDLEPPRSEFTVIETHEFYGEFQRLMAATYSEESRAGQGVLDARRDVRSDVGCGRSLRKQLADAPGTNDAALELRALTMLVFESEWRPGYDVTGGSSSAQPARVRLRVTPAELEDRATHWLSRRGYPFQQYLDQDLRSYTRSPDGLEDGSSVYQERQSRVLSKLDQAVAAAAPLVQLDNLLMPLVHPALGSEPSERYLINLSSLPFRAHPLESRITERMLNSVYGGGGDKGRKDEFDKILTQDSDLRYVDVISSLKKPIYPYVVSSLMNPIVMAWNRGSVSRTSFWSLRRSRPLREFIPAPQAHIRAMLRGWFTADALGLLRMDGHRVAVVVDAAGASPRFVDFPFPPLEPSTAPDHEDWDRPMYVLESLATAMLEVSRTHRLDPFLPYIALRDLGVSDPTQEQILKYRRVNPVLQAWLETGQVPSFIDTGAEATGALSRLPDAEARVVAMLARFKDMQSDLERRTSAYLEDVKNQPTTLSEPPLWPGLRDEIFVALEALIRALDTHKRSLKVE